MSLPERARATFALPHAVAALVLALGSACAVPSDREGDRGAPLVERTTGAQFVEDTGAVVAVATPMSAREPFPWPTAIPLADTLPGDVHGARVRRGRAILSATRDSLPAYVGNQLRCMSCHLEDGRRADALPWVGVMARFPQYRSRNALINRIEDRVNDCFVRSLSGRALPHDSESMRDIVAYMQFLSRGVPQGLRIAGQGAPAVRVTQADTTLGSAVYERSCVRCHGAAGEGTTLAPPLWGDGSYSSGAGMGRPRTAAAFIRANMPYDAPTLSEQEALNVAAYINAQPRRAYSLGHLDWPFGGAPVDVPYVTAGGAPQR